ncbi:oligosaccharide flippase family protein [bacterium]|nr:oligosaccharide flippase family protein [bacterium]
MSKSAFSATRWVLAGTIGFRALAFVGQVFILRALGDNKEIFGAYRGMVDIHLMFLAFFPFAVDSLLVREKRQRRRYAMALSMILAVTGAITVLGAAALMLLPTPGAGSFATSAFGDGATWHATLLMLPIFALMATKLSVRSMLSAELDFRRISIGEFGNGMLTFFGGAAAVYFYPHAWALMLAYMAGEAFECAYLYQRFRFRLAILAPRRWKMTWTLLRRNWNFCLTNTSDLVMNNLGSQLPGPLIVALVSATAAADYQASRMLIQLPILLLVGAVWRVAYPTISGVPEPVLQDRLLRITGTSAAMLVPGVLWLAWYAPASAFILGGSKYLSAAPLVQWMATYMALTACFSPISTLDMIRNKSHWGLIWNIFHTGGRIAVIWWFAEDGLLAVIAAMSLFSMALWIVWAAMLGDLAGCGLGRFTWNVVKFAPLWLVLAGCFHVIAMLDHISILLPPVVAMVPFAIYLGVVLKFFPAEAEMVWRLLRRK